MQKIIRILKGAIGDCLQKMFLCWLKVSSHPDSNYYGKLS